MSATSARSTRALGFGRGTALILLCGAVWTLRGGAVPEPEAQALGLPSWIQDTDHDGLTDEQETYFATASSDPALDANPFNADSDGDGEPDGFEYCLSGGTSIVTPGKTHAAEPKLTIASYQNGSSLVLSFLLMGSDIALVEDFKIFASTLINGKPVLVDVTNVWLKCIHSVGIATYGPHALFVFQATAPVGLIESNDSLAIAAVAKVAGATIGDSATYTASKGLVYRWRAQPGGSAMAAAAMSDSTAEPQGGAAAVGADVNQVCGSEDIQEPSNVGGVLTSIVVDVGCGAGTWSCSGSVCSMTGDAAKPRVVLDVDSLLD